MEINQHNILQLIHEKLAGIISGEDEAYLDTLIAGNRSVREEWEREKSKHSSSDLRDHFARFDDPAEWQKVNRAVLQAEHPGRKRRYLVIKAVAAAAVLAGIVFAAVKLVDKPEDLSPTGRAAVIGGDAVLLQLADGRSISLSGGRLDTVMNLTGARITASSDKSLSYTITGPAGAPAGPSGINTLTVPVGLDYKIQLADGTEVWMNSATRLRFPSSFTGETREVHLDGEAYLKVSKNAAKPFIVHLPGSSVRVMGTEFNVNTYDTAEVRVALVEGKVQMTAEGKHVTITPGQEAVFLPGKGTRLRPFDAEDVLSWRKGLYYFYNATLEDVCTVLPRWYGIAVKMDEPGMGEKPIAGMIDRNRPVEEFLKNLQASSRINYYFDADSVLHFKSR